MKKWITLLLTIGLVLVLAACGGNNDGGNNNNSNNNNANDASNNNDDELTQVIIGASSVPHAEILEEAQPILEEEGIELVIEQYEDYVLPNDDLASGTIDANYFQHIPYLEQTNEDTGYDLTHIG
ncbi:MAG TPA: MetQ/NlpA family ABC transporter substrate-binding protein, partial [Pseudogracilibacillus sp.]|nr:MetQ/NlpA family ABC transporter substrate-binding protein [Pseudogracilibacillus sp.]